VPAQTRGFLFSDPRGYLAYTERHGGGGARALLTRYRGAVRDGIASFGGAEIRTEGDSFYGVFDSVSAAVEAGLPFKLRLVARP
jgi:class 3 adenylate cyclase